MNHERATASKRQAPRVSTMDSTTPSRPPAFTGQVGGGVITAARRGLIKGVWRHRADSRCSSALRPGRMFADGADFGCGSEGGLGVRFGCGRLARRGLGHRLDAVLADGADLGVGTERGLGVRFGCRRLARRGVGHRLDAVLADGADVGFGTERGLGARFGCGRLARRGLSDRPGRMFAGGADFGCGSGCGLGAELAAGVDIARNANSRCASGRGLGARMACGCVPRPGADFGRELRGRGAGPDATFEVPVGGTWEAHATSRR
jgi:hypothetical protein